MNPITSTEFSALLKVSRQAINKAVRVGNLRKGDNGMIDLDDEFTILYVKKQEIKTKSKIDINFQKNEFIKKVSQLKEIIHESEHSRIDSLLRDNPRKIDKLLSDAKRAKKHKEKIDRAKELEPAPEKETPREQEESPEKEAPKEVKPIDQYDGVPHPDAKKNGDRIIETVNGKESLQCKKLEEEIEKLKINNQEKMGSMISRDLVIKIFAKIYNMEINELLQLKGILPEKMASAMKVTDPELIINSTALCERELYKFQSHMKRVINDFLVGLGSSIVEEDEKVKAS